MVRAPAMLRPVGQVSRKSRRPSHPFQLRHMPWQIQPFLIAPVLPGETLKNILLQSRAVTKPIKNGIVGIRIEHHRREQIAVIEITMLHIEEVILHPPADDPVFDRLGHGTRL